MAVPFAGILQSLLKTFQRNRIQQNARKARFRVIRGDFNIGSPEIFGVFSQLLNL